MLTGVAPYALGARTALQSVAIAASSNGCAGNAPPARCMRQPVQAAARGGRCGCLGYGFGCGAAGALCSLCAPARGVALGAGVRPSKPCRPRWVPVRAVLHPTPEPALFPPSYRWAGKRTGRCAVRSTPSRSASAIPVSYRRRCALGAYSAETGRSFHGKADGDSTANWTPVPAQTGHLGA